MKFDLQKKYNQTLKIDTHSTQNLKSFKINCVDLILPIFSKH